MSQRRTFNTADPRCDFYETEEGKVIGVFMPIRTMNRIAWGPTRLVPKTPSSHPIMAADERMHLRDILAGKEISNQPSNAMVRVRRSGDSDLAPLAKIFFGDLLLRSGSSRKSHAHLLGVAASATLALNKDDIRAARALVGLLFSEHTSDFDRQFLAAYLSEAYRPHVETDAMAILRDALLRLLGADDQFAFAPFAYSCVVPLLEVARDDTLQRCRTELRQRGEDDRATLVNWLSSASGADVLSLLRSHMRVETSPRLRLRLMVVLGEFLADRTRDAILRIALANESPWLRWQAIQELWRLPPTLIVAIVNTNLANEPDEILRGMLKQAHAAAEALGRKRLRSRYP